MPSRFAELLCAKGLVFDTSRASPDLVRSVAGMIVFVGLAAGSAPAAASPAGEAIAAAKLRVMLASPDGVAAAKEILANANRPLRPSITLQDELQPGFPISAAAARARSAPLSREVLARFEAARQDLRQAHARSIAVDRKLAALEIDERKLTQLLRRDLREFMSPAAVEAATIRYDERRSDSAELITAEIMQEPAVKRDLPELSVSDWAVRSFYRTDRLVERDIAENLLSEKIEAVVEKHLSDARDRIIAVQQRQEVRRQYSDASARLRSIDPDIRIERADTMPSRRVAAAILAAAAPGPSGRVAARMASTHSIVESPVPAAPADLFGSRTQ